MAITTKDTESKLNGLSSRGSVGANHDTSMASFGTSVEKFTQDAGNQIGAAMSEVSDKATTYVKSTRTYVEDHPFRAVAYAAGAGVALGSILTMMLRRKH